MGRYDPDMCFKCYQKGHWATDYLSRDKTERHATTLTQLMVAVDGATPTIHTGDSIHTLCSRLVTHTIPYQTKSFKLLHRLVAPMSRLLEGEEKW